MNGRRGGILAVALGGAAALIGQAGGAAAQWSGTLSESTSDVSRDTTALQLGASCTLRYVDGTTEPAASCDAALCADFATVQDCQETLGEGACNLVDSCDCEYDHVETYTETDRAEDTLLSGVVNLWQFEHGCGLGGDNAVGCGPVASAMITYWWAQQGYDGLVDGFLDGAGSGPADREHDWKALVRTFREDYLDGGLCVPFRDGWFFGYDPEGQYAVPPARLRDGLEQYIADAGYDPRVEHYRVCESCAASGDSKLTGHEGLDLIKTELRAGRPVIMGMNVGQSLGSWYPIFDPIGGGFVNVYTGELSNGTPVLGTIDHFVVVTGYRQIGGFDVLTLNMGWGEDPDTGDSSADIEVLWNPGGKWLHLFTVDIASEPDGSDWCAIDRGIGPTFRNSGRLELSHGSQPVDIPLAGSACGIVRDSVVSYEYVTEDVGYTCWTGGRVPTLDDADPRIDDGGGFEDPRDGYDSGILDQLDPLP